MICQSGQRGGWSSIVNAEKVLFSGIAGVRRRGQTQAKSTVAEQNKTHTFINNGGVNTQRTVDCDSSVDSRRCEFAANENCSTSRFLDACEPFRVNLNWQAEETKKIPTKNQWNHSKQCGGRLSYMRNAPLWSFATWKGQRHHLVVALAVALRTTNNKQRIQTTNLTERGVSSDRYTLNLKFLNFNFFFFEVLSLYFSFYLTYAIRWPTTANGLAPGKNLAKKTKTQNQEMRIVIGFDPCMRSPFMHIERVPNCTLLVSGMPSFGITMKMPSP